MELGEILRRKRRRTPADDKAVLDEWRNLFEEYRNQGYSAHQSHLKIAEAYRASSHSVYAYLRYGRSTKHHGGRPYSAQKQNPNYLPKQAFLKRLRRNPATYLAPLYSSAHEAIDLEELAFRLQSAHAYTPRMTTLRRIAEEGNPRTGEPILVDVSAANEEPRYRLADGLYGHSR